MLSLELTYESEKTLFEGKLKNTQIFKIEMNDFLIYIFDEDLGTNVVNSFYNFYILKDCSPYNKLENLDYIKFIKKGMNITCYFYKQFPHLLEEYLNQYAHFLHKYSLYSFGTYPTYHFLNNFNSLVKGKTKIKNRKILLKEYLKFCEHLEAYKEISEEDKINTQGNIVYENNKQILIPNTINFKTSYLVKKSDSLEDIKIKTDSSFSKNEELDTKINISLMEIVNKNFEANKYLWENFEKKNKKGKKQKIKKLKNKKKKKQKNKKQKNKKKKKTVLVGTLRADNKKYMVLTGVLGLLLFTMLIYIL